MIRVTEVPQQYTQATIQTASDLGSVAKSASVRELARLTLPEIEAVVNLVARVVPAGNVPGVILNGLARIGGRRLPRTTVERDITLLFKGVEQALDMAMFGAFFAGPAAVIWAYQNLLKLAGKNPDDAFPEGTWQFYVDYALRNDTARHANETHGFDTILHQHGIRLKPVDRLSAWVMTAIYCLHQYPMLLENEWRERVHTFALRQITRDEPNAAHYAALYRRWEQQRQYDRGSNADEAETYPMYRRRQFDQFMQQATADLRDDLRREWSKQIGEAERNDFPNYLRQMSILATLEPGAYGETRRPIALQQACIAVIRQGHYYLLPVCAPNSDQPADVESVREQIAALLRSTPNRPGEGLAALAHVKRGSLHGLRSKLSANVIKDLDALRNAPILINTDVRPRRETLSDLRQAERGIGDHALTLFDTGETIVFDQSHIFFDGAWGAALAEILTNEALSWAVYLDTLSDARPQDERPVPLPLALQPADRKLIAQAARVTAEVGAESAAIDVKAMLSLRRLFKLRSDLLQLTVNDLLILYRAIHAAMYQPDPRLAADLQRLARKGPERHAAQAALEAIDQSRKTNPAILIPVDASVQNPRDRVYPLCFEVPLQELDLLALHEKVKVALAEYIESGEDAYEEFDELQRTYLATLAGFGVVLAKAKEVAAAGATSSVGSIKLLAHVPFALQRLLNTIPNRFDTLNDLIKGREIFSNIGAVAAGSTLTRFMTAKDDNDKKTLAWAVLTDSDGVMRITLRDFRPHVALFEAIGRRDMAARIAQDYLDAYTRGLNEYIHDLRQITLTSNDTRTSSSEQTDAG